MDHTYWSRQTSEPLYPDILWSRPESKAGAGKLLIIGGNQFGFGAPGQAYNSVIHARVGVVRVLMPEAIKKVVKNLLPDADFAPSTPSGSFARKALGDLISLSNWSDATLLAGDLGRNSETAMVLESFVSSYTGLLTITQDAIEYFKEIPIQIVDRENTLLVLSLSQLQKVFINTPSIRPITLSMTTPQLAETLHEYTSEHACGIVTLHNNLLFVAVAGKVSTTSCDKDIWRVETAARATVFWLQNPTKQFEAVTTSLLQDVAE